MSDREILLHLTHGDIRLVGQFMWGSNFTFLVEVELDADVLQAVYKPSRGERRLWDFPSGSLAAREVAAYLTSRELGWNMIPPTVLRVDGPTGPGSLQLYLEFDPERHYFTFSDAEKERLRPVVLLDVLINNADRKGGHVILDSANHIWLIDHGLCFHENPKLRTVIWDFAGQSIPEKLLADIEGLRERLESDAEIRSTFLDLISPSEIEALIRRANQLLSRRLFPSEAPGRSFPWPLV